MQQINDLLFLEENPMQMKRLMKLPWGGLILLLLAAAPARGTNPVPFIDQPLVPAAALAGSSGFTLTVKGGGFVSGSAVYWNGTALTTTFVSSKQLTATVPPANIAYPATAWVTVSSPFVPGPPGWPISNVAFFEVTNPTATVAFRSTDFATGGEGPQAVAVGDFNGDGTLDLVVANFSGSSVSVLLGNGDGTFQPAVSYSAAANNLGNNPYSVAVGDFNGDGIPDLAVANEISNNVSVLLGNGDGTFQNAVNSAVGTNPQSVTVGDFNGDGFLDLAVANSGSNSVSVLLGNGDGTFQTAVNYALGTNTSPSSVTVGDFNGDGILDLAVADFGTNTVSVLLGKGDGTFEAAVNYAVDVNPISVTAADFNGDGKLDLAVANNGGNGYVSVLLGNGDGTFKKAVNYAAGSTLYTLAAGDLNGDGKMDLVVANSGGNSVSVLPGNGDGTFEPAVSYAVGPNPRSVAVGDFDEDGRMDLAVANANSSNVSILLQSAPTGGSAQLVGGNTFIGNQTVSGTVTATSFVGGGYGLLNLNPASLNAGTAGINITGNAATVTNGVYTTGSYANPNWMASLEGSKITGTVPSATTAGSATTAATAANATALGGVAAGNYARLDISNTFAGNQSVSGNVTIGSGGTPITEHVSILVNPSFPALNGGGCAIAEFPLKGAADGDTIALGVPNERMFGGNLIYTAWVSASNSVTVRACNIGSSRSIAGKGSIRVDLWKHSAPAGAQPE